MAGCPLLAAKAPARPGHRLFRLLLEFFAFASFLRLVDFFPETLPTLTCSSFFRLEPFERPFAVDSPPEAASVSKLTVTGLRTADLRAFGLPAPPLADFFLPTIAG